CLPDFALSLLNLKATRALSAIVNKLAEPASSTMDLLSLTSIVPSVLSYVAFTMLESGSLPLPIPLRGQNISGVNASASNVVVASNTRNLTPDQLEIYTTLLCNLVSEMNLDSQLLPVAPQSNVRLPAIEIPLHSYFPLKLLDAQGNPKSQDAL